jgi:hypothetical protein
MMIDAILNVVGPWWFVLAILVAVAGTARYARLVTYDVFPPSIRFRSWWAERVREKHPLWVDLFHCPHCFGFWLILVCGVWFAFTFEVEWLAWAWWIFWGWGALAYAMTYVITYDGAQDE